MSLWQEVAGFAAKVPPKKKKCQDEASEEEKQRKRNVKRALAMAGEGHFTRAIQALTSADMAEKSRATVKLLRDKHPAPSLPPGLLPTTDSDPLTLYGPDVYKAALKFKKGTAAGPSGLRPEHLRVVLQSPAIRREGASNTLTKLLNRMVAGMIPLEVAPYVCGAHLHASKKRDGGIRPIAVGDLLQLLAFQVVSQDKFYTAHVSSKGSCPKKTDILRSG